MGPGLTIAIAEKRFAAGVLFRDLALTVAPRSVLAIIGPSGVGKSTLLRLIAGIDREFSGEVTVGGAPVAQAPPPGFVFQDSRLLPWLSAEANIRAVSNASRAEAVALLKRVGLAGSEEAFPRQLSGGMQRRVALARALSVNPALLLLDEPFVSLDRTLIGGMQRLIADLVAATQPTVLIVSHVAEDAAALADRVVVLGGRPARIVADRTLEIPRAERDPATVLRLAAELGALTPEGG